MLKRCIIALALGLGLASTGLAIDKDKSNLTQGWSALESGNTDAAIQSYEAAVDEGLVNGHLFYNLGIAYYRAGRTGDAVGAFLAARRFLPRDPDVAVNLRYSLSKISDKLDAETPRDVSSPLSMVLDRVTARELALVLGILTGLSGLIVLLTIVRPQLASWRRGAFAGVILPVVAAALLAVKIMHPAVWGAVHVTPKASVFSGPSEQNTLLFELHEGAPVLIVERGLSGYLRIQLSDGKSGWIAGSQVKVLGPQFGAL